MCYLSLSKLRNPGNNPVENKENEVHQRLAKHAEQPSTTQLRNSSLCGCWFAIIIQQSTVLYAEKERKIAPEPLHTTDYRRSPNEKPKRVHPKRTLQASGAHGLYIKQ